MDSRRLERWLVTPQMFIEVAKHGLKAPIEVVAHGLPEDARYVAATFDHDRFCVVLFIESETFAVVPENGTVPLREPTQFRRVEQG